MKNIKHDPKYQAGFIDGMRTAAAIAFDVESSYAPYKLDDGSKCCRCSKSHAKADGAAEVVNAIQARLKY